MTLSEAVRLSKDRDRETQRKIVFGPNGC